MLRHLLALAVIAAALVGSLGAPLPVDLRGSYLIHFVTGAALVAALAILLRGRIALALAAVTTAALLLELVQAAFITGRSGDALDALLGIIGALLAALLLAVGRSLRDATR
jgi:VanZ family protein